MKSYKSYWVLLFLVLLLLTPFSSASILDLDGNHDDQNNRLSKYEPFLDQTTYYVSDSFVQIRNATGTYTTTYYRDRETLLAREDFDGTNRKSFYYHPDHLGSTDLITDQQGNTVEETTYKPYGGLVSGGATSDFLYTGKELDDTGLIAFPNRYYDPTIPIWTQCDVNIYNSDGKTKAINTQSIQQIRGELCVNRLM